MVLKIILIVLVLLLGLILLLPFVLNLAGIPLLQFGTPVGGTLSTEGAVLLRTLNEGEQWENSSVPERENLSFPSQIFALVFHPTNPDIIFLGTKSAGLWKTFNGGAFWKKMSDRNNVLDPKADVREIAIWPADPNLMYAAVFQNKKGRVLKSEDGGESFREVYFTPADNFIVSDLFIDPRDRDHVIVTTGQGGVLESRNGGKTWRVVTWFTVALEKLLVNPLDVRDMLVLASGDSLFKSVTGGREWADITQGVKNLGAASTGAPVPAVNPFSALSGTSQRYIQAITADPNDFSVLFISTRDGLFRSENGGYIWNRIETLVPANAFPIATVAAHPRFSKTVLIGASTQMYRTDDSGINWSAKTLPIKTRIKELVIHPLRPEAMFIILGK